MSLSFKIIAALAALSVSACEFRQPEPKDIFTLRGSIPLDAELLIQP